MRRLSIAAAVIGLLSATQEIYYAWKDRRDAERNKDGEIERLKKKLRKAKKRA
jgi:hypothetical protein